jgi:hypothetical protein
MNTPHENHVPAHITDEQFTDLLLGTVPPPVAAHLDVCPQCAQEADRVSGAIGSFEQQSRLWAERRAAATPMVARPHQPLVSSLTRPAAWSAAAATVVLALGLGLIHNKPQQTVTQPQSVQTVATVQPTPEVAPATLKADNELLSAIDGELSADAAPPASVYGLDTGAHHAKQHPAKGISNE